MALFELLVATANSLRNARLPRLLGQPLGGVIRKSARDHRYWLLIRTSSKDGKSDIGTRLIV